MSWTISWAKVFMRADSESLYCPCNRYVKWESLLKRSLRHWGRLYCYRSLCAGREAAKRQIFPKRNLLLRQRIRPTRCYNLTQEQLSHTLMPVGEYTKDQIRQIAEDIGPQVAHKADSQGNLLHSDNDCRAFIEREAESVAGGILVTADGTVISRHEGITHYTIGQRKGLKPCHGPHPVFVTEIRPETNEVAVIGEAGGMCLPIPGLQQS